MTGNIISRLLPTGKQALLLLLLTVTMTTAADELPTFRPCRVRPQPLPAIHQTTGRRAAPTDRFKGDRRQMTILVTFSDLNFKEADPLAFWNKVFNKKDFNETPFYGSVHDYFYDQSYGLLNLQFDLYHVTLSTEHSVYRSNEVDDRGCPILVQDVIAALKGTVSDWSPYDWDGDGYVDQLLILYPGMGMNDGGDENTIWPNQSYMTDYDYSPVEVPTAAEGKSLLVNCYCCVNELTRNNTYGNFGTICHEYSHCFGLPDFYNGRTMYVYKWDIMDYGNYNNEGFCPPCYSVHERMLLGWTTPTELTATTTVTGMRPTNSSQDAYIIRSEEDSNDFYVIENRQQQGWDLALPGSGIIIFHVIYDETIWKTGIPNKYAVSSPLNRYTIKKANNNNTVKTSSGWAYPYEGNDSLTALSAPACDYEGISLTNMTVTGETASFNFIKNQTSGIGTPHAKDAVPTTVCDLQGRPVSKGMMPKGVCIVRYSDGSIKKVKR